MSRFRFLALLPALLLAASAPAAHARDLFVPAPEPPGRALALTPRAFASRLVLDVAAARDFQREGGGELTLTTPEGGNLALTLEPFDLLGGGEVTITDESGRRPAQVGTRLYRGRVADDPRGWALLALSPGRAMGRIEAHGRSWQLLPERGPAAAEALHTLAPEEAFTPAVTERLCALDASLENAYDRAHLGPGRTAEPGAAQLNALRYRYDIAVDCDYEIYGSKFGGDLVNATSYMLVVLGTVSLAYERDVEITLRFPYLNLWTTSNDPYDQPDTGTQLTQFRSYFGSNRPPVPHALAHLVSGRPLGGGIAWLSTVCDVNFGFAVSAIDAVYSYPTATTTWDVVVIAHELGHNFGAWHTHSCAYSQNGYFGAGTPDTCQASEGGCHSATNRLPPNRGTIMSYCHLIAGVSGGVRFEFHPASVSRMRAIAAGGACRTDPALRPVRNPQIAATATGARISWTLDNPPGFVRHDVFRSRLPLDLNPVFIGSTTTNLFDDAGFGTHYYRVRTHTATDSSAWSGEVSLNLCAFPAAGTISAASLPSAIALGDFNEDGIEDAVSANAGASTFSVLLGNGAAGVGNGTFAAAVSNPTLTTPNSVAVFDADDDGISDLVLGCEGANALALHRGLGAAGVGNGTFAAGTTIALSFAPTALTVADADEDGIEDLVVVGGGSTLAVLRGNGTDGVGDGTFAPAELTTVSSSPLAVLAHDFDSDGILDLAVAANGLRVLRGNGSAGKGDGTFAAPVQYATGSSPAGLATADLDGDGITDLLVSNAGASSLSVFRGNGGGGTGDGTFTSLPSVNLGNSSPRTMRIADWNEDGFADVAVTHNSSARVVAVLLGNGGGSFTGPFTTGVGTSPWALAAGDFDEDGGVDLLSSNRGSGSLARLLAGCDRPAPALAVLAPSGGETWIEGEERVISWSRSAAVAAVDVEISRDGGANWSTLARDMTDTSFVWTVTPPSAVGTVRVRIVDRARRQFTAASAGALTVYSLASLDASRTPAPLALLGAWPNPMRGALQVSFSLPGAGAAEVELLDLAGRRVASSRLTAPGAGTHRVTLTRARALAPGLYLVRLSHEGRTRSLKVAVVE